MKAKISLTVQGMDVVNSFQQQFDGRPLAWRAPGRVNLMGEHTDYTGGLVLPMAIQLETQVAIAPRSDTTLRIHSATFGETVAYALTDLPDQAGGHWSDYCVGVVLQLRQAGLLHSGADLLIDSTIPSGAGLSSSAALEVALAMALLEMEGHSISRIEVAELCQRAESSFVGAQCGIMDMFVSLHAQKGHATFLDCATYETRLIPLPTGLRIAVLDTGVRHALAAGEYNQRRSECEQGLGIVQARYPEVASVAAMTPQILAESLDDLAEPLARRLRHIVSENERVRATTLALEEGRVEALGALFAASQKSLREDFVVSCRELDLLFDLATHRTDVTAIRMTGGGFGGAEVLLTTAGDAPGEEIIRAYNEVSGATGRAIEVWPSAGASPVTVAV